MRDYVLMCQFSHVEEKIQRKGNKNQKYGSVCVRFCIYARKRVNYCQVSIIETGALLHLSFSV